MAPRNAKEVGKALSGLKVVDFGWNVTAPYMAKKFADFGATVVKVESGKRIDTMRTILPFSKGRPGINRALLFLSYNCGKYGIAIDLSQPKGVELAKRLIKWGDVVIESFMPGTMEKLGLGYEELKKVKRDIIMLRTSLQGAEGPHAQVGALGVMMQGLSGVVNPMGWPNEPPSPIPCATTDFISPLYGMAVTLAALEHRRKTGEGSLIDFSQFEAGVTYIAPDILNFVANGKLQEKVGNTLARAAPHNAFRCKGDDRWCAIAVFTEEEWKAFCGVIGDPQWTKDPKFTTFVNRKENEAELDQLVEEWTFNYSPEEVMEKLQKAGIAAGIVANGRDFYEDPQLRYRHHFWSVTHPEVGEFFCEGPPAILSETPAEITMPAPCLGEHTEFVCREFLNMPDDEFIDLYTAGVLA